MSAYGALADWYDSLTEDVDYPGLYEYLTAIFTRRGVKPKRILDMACGTGSLSLLFAEHGKTCFGMDLSEDMLTRAWDKAQAMRHPPRFLQGDMADFSLPELVDALVCMLDSFNYLAQPEQGESAIRCFSEALRPGGLLVFDVRPPEQLKDFDGQMFMDETEDVVCIWRTEFWEETNQCFYGMDIFEREGDLWRRHQEEHLEYAYALPWLKAQLEKNGFRDIEFYGDRTFLTPQPDEDRVFIIARKDETL
jgi:SAM-dependent methyltransferase